MKALKTLSLLMLASVVSFSVVIWFYPPTGNFTVNNPFWNGLSEYSKQAKIVPLSSYSNLPSPPKGTTLIVIPYEQFTDSELAQLKGYVSNGGTLVLMDDYGYGNQVLDGLGVNIRFTGQPLLDPLYNYKNEWLPKITDFTSTPISANVSSIVFNHATSLNQTADATVIAQSSTFSFLDTNNNGTWETNEPTGPLPVAAYEKISQGYVVAIADPSLLINGMINLDNNQQFITNAIDIQSTNPKIFVDQTHMPKTTLDESKEVLAIIYGVVTYPFVTLSVIVVILAYLFKPIWKKREKNVENK